MYILGDKVNNKVEDLIKNEHHPRVFSELEEFEQIKVKGWEKKQWKETARWVKFEEDVEAGGDRWSKPHVGKGAKSFFTYNLYDIRKELN